MWRLNKLRLKTGGQTVCLEELRLKRREQERVLRQARRDKQLVSKRLLLNDDEDQSEITMDIGSREQDVVSLFHKLQSSGLEREIRLKALGAALRDPSAQLTFIKQENSIHLLVGLLTGPNAACRLQAVRCLHELSHSPNTNIAPACLPATPYLLTYLSGQSTKFTELCLYTMGNLCPQRDAVQEKLLAQGIIPALASCIENQIHNLAVVEAASFCLSQLLQAKDGVGQIIQMVLATSLPSSLISVLTPDPSFGLAPAIECAWCLHYLTSSSEDNTVMLAHGALSRCSSLLVSLGDAVAKGSKEDGLELLICPLLRCAGNLVSSCPVEDLSSQVGGVRILVTLCALHQSYIQTQPGLARESAWILNNLTAQSSAFCSALLTFNLVPGLIQLLQFSQGINTMILRVLANVAHKRKEFCVQLSQLGLLSALCTTLKMADKEIVALSMDVLYMLIVSNPQVAVEFVRQGGCSQLEALQYNNKEEIRRRATCLIENHLPSH